MNEDSFIKLVKPYIDLCRPGDWKHCQRVVKWVKELASETSDLALLIRAGYIHDIGWYKIISKDKKITKEELKKFEPQANNQSEGLIRKVLRADEHLTEEDVLAIIRLVKACDSHESSNSDEEIIVDADNLSKLDINHLKEKYLPSEWLKMYELWEETFSDRIKTEKGLEIYPELMEKLMMDIQKQMLL